MDDASAGFRGGGFPVMKRYLGSLNTFHREVVPRGKFGKREVFVGCGEGLKIMREV